MIKLLSSKKVKIPKIFFITSRDEIKQIPRGVPFIYADKEAEDYIVRIFEYEVLFQAAVKTGLPFKFKEILLSNGYLDLEDFRYSHPIYCDFTSGDSPLSHDHEELTKLDGSIPEIKDYIKDSSVHVDIQQLKNLHIFPTWLEDTEKGLSANINFIFNPVSYNKKYDGFYGAYETANPKKNLIITDLSGSVPKGCSSIFLAMSKYLSTTFYADLLVTGSKSTLYDYSEIESLNIDTIYSDNGTDNDQTYFLKLISTEKQYNTCIVMGDNHSPCDNWENKYNKKTKCITRDELQATCRWKVENLICFHTSDNLVIPGYGECFKTENVTHIKNWVRYLNN